MGGVNGDVYVAATAKGIGFAGETIVVQGDAVGMARIHFTSSQHRFHLADKMRECHIQLKTFCFAELTGDTGPVSNCDTVIGWWSSPKRYFSAAFASA